MWKKFKDWTSNNSGSESKFQSEQILINNQLFTLRSANESDIDRFLKMEKELYEGRTPWDAGAFTREIRRHQDALYLILENTNDLVAFIGLNWNHEESHITNFAVLTSYQEQGIGRWLLNYAIDYSRKLKAKKLTLEVSVENNIAIHLYHTVGFRDGNIKRFYYNFNNGDAMNMELDLERKEHEE
ncbi:ribosomal protein S18-alanine N-acetyltransferase [Xylocopilactobacillus apis]|uniref:Ribosomal-protein-alanine acetyltransferase n=1 Tax=Xylocopilactobacillus apis TaxID=2932183 RepID=A0AAU9CZF3_9LACO|nr:ribosomal protein S18-alanine N-acetyltransferase [Xylocopilactobacillus apis]BDR56653.1 ribosomal-protein-alanine acetyltransferase [Xylocopilactobacillus apis]